MQQHKSFITKFGELIDQHRAEQQDTTTSPSRPDRASRLIRWLLPNGGTPINDTAARRSKTQRHADQPLRRPSTRRSCHHSIAVTARLKTPMPHSNQRACG